MLNPTHSWEASTSTPLEDIKAFLKRLEDSDNPGTFHGSTETIIENIAKLPIQSL